MAKVNKTKGGSSKDRDPEKTFHKYLINNPKKVLNGIEILDDEARLYKPGILLTRDFYSFERLEKKVIKGCFGRIDVVFKYRGAIYCGEIKYEPHKNSDFWDAMKVLGYTTYYKWQRETNGGTLFPKPAILMPKSRIKLEHQIIAGRLGIALFGIIREGNEFTMIPYNEIKGVSQQIFE
jgi:hypothetical protein